MNQLIVPNITQIEQRAVPNKNCDESCQDPLWILQVMNPVTKIVMIPAVMNPAETVQAILMMTISDKMPATSDVVQVSKFSIFCIPIIIRGLHQKY